MASQKQKFETKEDAVLCAIELESNVGNRAPCFQQGHDCHLMGA